VNGNSHFVVSSDDVNLLVKNMNTTKKKTEYPLDASEEICVQTNAEKLCIYMSQYQNAGQNHNVKRSNKPYENAPKSVKSPWYPLDRRLGGSQSRSGRSGEEKNYQPPPGNEP
jgi:hypothetical protein